MSILYGTNERKFLTVRQIFRKLLPHYDHLESEDFAPYYWAYQHASDRFPTLVIERACRHPECIHTVFIYSGQGLLRAMRSSSQIQTILQTCGFHVPNHFSR